MTSHGLLDLPAAPSRGGTPGLPSAPGHHRLVLAQ